MYALKVDEYIVPLSGAVYDEQSSKSKMIQYFHERFDRLSVRKGTKYTISGNPESESDYSTDHFYICPGTRQHSYIK